MNDIEKLEEIERAFEGVELEYPLHQQLRECFSIARASLKREERHTQLATPAEHLVQYNHILDERLKVLRRQLAERDAAICGMREDFTDINEYWNGNNNERAVSDALQHALDVSKQALSAAPTCPHKEEAEKWKGMSERCGDDSAKRELEFVTLKAQLAERVRR